MSPTTRPRLPLAALAVAVALVACSKEPAQAPAAQQAAAADGFVRTEWALPTVDGAGQPDLAVGPDGRLLLSWIRKLGDRNALQYAAYLGDDTWESAPKTIAVGRTLSANWANTPHIAMTEDGSLWAHWLQGSADPAASPHASDILLTRSPDNGVHWSAPVPVNDDGTPTEHGFVSLWPAAPNAIGVAWLDGRNTVGAEHEHKPDEAKHEHAKEGADGKAGWMTVRSVRFDAAMKRTDEVEIDTATCDCCGTDVAVTRRGALLAYRDRTEDEVRDIVTVRADAKGWTTPKVVNADGWKMPACPLNGPAVAANGANVAVAWYTAPGEKPALRIARSVDAGDTFAAPIDIEAGEAVQGRVDVAMDDTATWLVWLREDAKGQTVQLARYPVTGKPTRTTLATLQGRGRATGFPKIAVRKQVAFVVWTDIVDGRTRLAAMKVAAAP
jgi:hypothetical protein